MRVIGIGGGTGSGKSTIANALANHFDAAIIRIDDYYRPLDHLTFEEREKINFDAPGSIDHHLLLEHLGHLREGQSIERPNYDFSRHTRAIFGEIIHPKELVIIEGLFALHWSELNDFYYTKIFVETPLETRFARRLKRDIEERGRDEADVRFRFHSHVNPMHEAYVQPTAGQADLIVFGNQEFDHAFDQVVTHVQQSWATVL